MLATTSSIRKFSAKDISNLPNKAVGKKPAPTPNVSNAEVSPKLTHKTKKTVQSEPVVNKLDAELLAEIESLVVVESHEQNAKEAMLTTAEEPQEELVFVFTPHSQVEPTVDLCDRSRAPSTTTICYTRDFLLSFADKCNQSISGLLPEVMKGYVDPLAAPQASPLRKGTSARFSSPNGAGASPSRKTPSKLVSNDGVIAPIAANRKTPKSAKANKSKSAESALVIEIHENPQAEALFVEVKPLVLDADEAAGAESCENTDDAAKAAAKLEWRPKPVQKTPRKEKPKETDPVRLAARQKQLDIGMNTPGYARYLELVPAEKRKKEGPRMPDIYQVCSKRSWDGQVRKWRRELHQYDPEGLQGQNIDDDIDVGSSSDSEEVAKQSEEITAN